MSEVFEMIISPFHRVLFHCPGLSDLPFEAAASSSQESLRVSETSSGYEVAIDLPGFGADQVKLEAHKQLLTITAGDAEVCKGGREESSAPLQRRTIRRSLSIPENVDESGITARMDKGVLTVTLPKRPEEAPRRVVVAGPKSKL